jgi:hypothetical protein
MSYYQELVVTFDPSKMFPPSFAQSDFDRDALEAMRARLPEYLAARGVELLKQGSRLVGRCPVHDDSSPSFAVFDNGTACGCFPCDFRGDVFAVSQWLGRASTFPEAIADVAAVLGVQPSPGRAQGSPRHTQAQPRPARQAAPFTLRESDRDRVQAARLAFNAAFDAGEQIIDDIAENLGIDWSTMRMADSGECGLGLSAGSYGKPTWLCYRYPTGLKWRNPDPTAKLRFEWLAGRALAPWRWGRATKPKVRTVYLAEGESDALALLQAGLEDDDAACVASPGTSFPASWVPLFKGKRVVLCFDNDGPGQAASAKVAVMLHGTAAEVLALDWREVFGAKDCRGVLQQSGAYELRRMALGAVPVNHRAEPLPIDTMLAPIPDDFDDDPIPESKSQPHSASTDGISIPTNLFPLPAGEVSFTQSAEIIFPIMGERRQLFMRSRVTHEIVNGHDGTDFLTPVTPERFCNLIEGFGYKVARRTYDDKRGVHVWRTCTFPVSSAKVLLSSDSAHKYLPAIKQLSNCPIFAASGKILTKGYHDHAGGTYISHGTKPPEVPLDAAKEALLGLLADFGFVTGADRSRALASLVSTALKMGAWIYDDFPLDVAEGDQSQSGKTYRQKLVARIYNEIPSAITSAKGGVGSVDEAIATALVRGRPFITLDNFRGRLDSTILEGAIRGSGMVSCRTLRASAEVDTRPFIWQLSTNGAEFTRDIANRSIITRIRKQPDGYQFRTFPEGDLLAHVESNQSFFLGAIFAIIREWKRADCPKTNEHRHDFRGWCQSLDWIVQHILGMPPLLDGHREEQARTANPNLQWLRDVAMAANSMGKLCSELTASELVGIAEDAGIDFPGNPRSQEDPPQRAGKILGKLFRESEDRPILVDGFIVTRREVTTYENGPKIHKNYVITK